MSQLDALGKLIGFARGPRKWSVVTAAKKAGIAHSTWRRVEDGLSVRTRTYSAIAETFGIGQGLLQRAAYDPEALMEAAHALGVDTSAIDRGEIDTIAFIAQLARGRGGAQTRTPAEDALSGDQYTIALDPRTQRCLNRLLVADPPEYLSATDAICDALPLLGLAVEQTRPENGGGHLAIVRPSGAIEMIHLT